MNLMEHLAGVFVGAALFQPLCGAEVLFQGFGKPWTFYSGTALSEKNDAVSMPVKPGGMYIGLRRELKKGVYSCSFEYKFGKAPSSGTVFQFCYTGSPSLYVNLLPGTSWSSVRFHLANTEEGMVKFGLGINSASENRLELRNFKIEQLSEADFRSMIYPQRTDFWFNRSSDRKNSTISVERADDHVLAGERITLKAGPQFKTDGTLLLMTLDLPLPRGKKYRLSCDLKSDRNGSARIAASDEYRTERIGNEWRKITFDFQRKSMAKPTANVSFQTLNKEIRELSVKDLKLEMVD